MSIQNRALRLRWGRRAAACGHSSRRQRASSMGRLSIDSEPASSSGNDFDGERALLIYKIDYL